MISVVAMQKAFRIHTFGRYEMLCPNIHYVHNELDIFGLRKSGYIDEVEIKLSRSDFKADFKKTVSVKGGLIEWAGGSYREHVRKPKHEAISQGLYPCNYFSFLVPEGLIEEREIPAHAGLYVFSNWDGKAGFVREVRKPPLMHKRKISDESKYKVALKMVYKYWQVTT